MNVPDGHRLLVSADTLVEQVHFPKNADPALLARRALRVNLSDMAAMGATPRWYTLSLVLPAVNAPWLDAFSQGLKQDAAAYECHLIGGDTTKGPLTIGIQILGTVPAAQPYLARQGAQVGDLVVVTGSLGDARGALPYLASDNNEGDAAALLDRYWLPEPRVALAQRAREHIRAACDISDGLLGDLGHLCRASGVSAIVDGSRVPLSAALRNTAGHDALRYAVTGGDDYELCMAVSPEAMPSLMSAAESLGIPITEVGQFVAAEGSPHVQCLDESGNHFDFEHQGYQHF